MGRKNISISKMSAKIQALFQSIEKHEHAKFTRMVKQFTADELNEAKDAMGNRPLHIACAQNNHEAVSQLLAINNIDVNVETNYGRTPFMLAIFLSSIDCVKLLAENKNVDIFHWCNYFVKVEGKEEIT